MFYQVLGLFTQMSADICANDKLFIILQRYYHQEQNSGLIDVQSCGLKPPVASCIPLTVTLARKLHIEVIRNTLGSEKIHFVAVSGGNELGLLVLFAKQKKKAWCRSGGLLTESPYIPIRLTLRGWQMLLSDRKSKMMMKDKIGDHARRKNNVSSSVSLQDHVKSGCKMKTKRLLSGFRGKAGQYWTWLGLIHTHESGNFSTKCFESKDFLRRQPAPMRTSSCTSSREAVSSTFQQNLRPPTRLPLKLYIHY